MNYFQMERNGPITGFCDVMGRKMSHEMKFYRIKQGMFSGMTLSCDGKYCYLEGWMNSYYLLVYVCLMEGQIIHPLI